MKVAVDIDGVLSDTFSRFRDELRKQGHNVDVPPDLTVNTHMGSRRLFPNVSQKEITELYEGNQHLWRKEYELISGSDIVLSLLNADIIAVTNRRIFEDADVCSATKSWIQKHNLPILEVVHTSDKAAACKDLGVDVLIEDTTHNAHAVAQVGIPVLLRDQDYNADANHELITRFSHWIEVPVLLRRILE